MRPRYKPYTRAARHPHPAHPAHPRAQWSSPPIAYHHLLATPSTNSRGYAGDWRRRDRHSRCSYSSPTCCRRASCRCLREVAVDYSKCILARRLIRPLDLMTTFQLARCAWSCSFTSKICTQLPIAWPFRRRQQILLLTWRLTRRKHPRRPGVRGNHWPNRLGDSCIPPTVGMYGRRRVVPGRPPVIHSLRRRPGEFRG